MSHLNGIPFLLKNYFSGFKHELRLPQRDQQVGGLAQQCRGVAERQAEAVGGNGGQLGNDSHPRCQGRRLQTHDGSVSGVTHIRKIAHVLLLFFDT